MSSAVRLYVLDGGTIEILDWSIYNPAAAAGARMSLANPVYLIDHERGSLVWDTGLGDELADRPDGLLVDDHAVFKVTATLAGQLRELGHPPESITHLALSHFHPDHVGNAGLFPNARLLVQKDEYEAAFGDDPQSHHYNPGLYKSLAGNEVELLEGDHDVFGDGLVQIKRLPGHTVGNQSLLVRLAEAGPVLLSGDLTHTWENWEQRAIPPALNVDKEESARSLTQAEEILDNEGATLWVQHDLEQYQGLRQAPEFYQ